MKNVTKPKGLDAFQAAMFSALQWVSKNQKALLMVTVPVVLVLLGGFAWTYVAAQQKDKRQAELAKIDIMYQDETKAIETKRQSVQKLIDVLPAARDAKNKAGSDTDKQKKALQEQMAAIKPDHAPSLAAYRTFFDKHQANPEGWAAGLRVAADAVRKQDYAAAEPILQQVIAASVSKPFYQVQGRLLLMAMLEDKGDYAKAIEVSDTLLKLVDKQLVPVVLLDKGRLQYLSNAKSEAMATLDALIKDHASSPEADKARGLRAIL